MRSVNFNNFPDIFLLINSISNSQFYIKKYFILNFTHDQDNESHRLIFTKSGQRFRIYLSTLTEIERGLLETMSSFGAVSFDSNRYFLNLNNIGRLLFFPIISVNITDQPSKFLLTLATHSNFIPQIYREI